MGNMYAWRMGEKRGIITEWGKGGGDDGEGSRCHEGRGGGREVTDGNKDHWYGIGVRR